MKKKLILLVVLLIILLIVIVSSIVIINKMENNKNQNEEELNLNGPKAQNELIEEFVKVQDNGIKRNTSEKFKETKVIDGLEITNTSFVLSNGQTIFKAKVINNSTNDFKEKIVNIVLLDKEGKEIGKIPAVINDVKAGGETSIETSVTLDFANAYNYKIEY